MFVRKKLEKDRLWNVLVYISILFYLKNVHCLITYEIIIVRAARWLIARGLGAYLFLQENFEKKEQLDTGVWEYILT